MTREFSRIFPTFEIQSKTHQHMKTTTTFLLFLFLFAQDVQAQDRAETEPWNITPPLPPASVVIPLPDIDIAFNKVYRHNIGGSVAKIQQKNFNEGLLQHPLFAVQGRLSGVQVHRPGGDPFTAPRVHIRGVSSLVLQSQPLYVINGVPNASLLSVAPEDVVSVTVLKDAAQTAIYGEAGSAGVVLIETFGYGSSGNVRGYRLRDTTSVWVRRPFNINFVSKIGIDNVAAAPPVADRETYLDLRPGQDLGDNNNWLNNVSRTAVSNVNGLNMTAEIGDKIRLRASGHNRNLRGVGNKTDGTDNFGNINLQSYIFDEALQLNAGAFGESLTADFDLYETFRYANSFSPTAPVFAGDDYFQIAQFDVFNPQAIQEQSETERRRTNATYYAELKSQLGNLRTTVRGSYGLTKVRQGVYYDRDAFYFGFFSNGFGEHFQSRRADRNVSADVKYDFFGMTYGKKYLTVQAGYELRRSIETAQTETGSDFNTDVSGFGNFTGFEGNFNDIDSTGFGYNIQAGWARIGLRTCKGVLTLNGTARYEGSSRLPKEMRNRLYKAGSAVVHLEELFGIKKDFYDTKDWSLRVGYGESGNFPDASNLSQAGFFDGGTIFFEGNPLPLLLLNRLPNQELRPEVKTEWTVGSDFDFYFKGNRLTGGLSWYTNRIDDVLDLITVPVFPTGSTTVFGNYDDIYLKNQGWEFDLAWSRRKNGLTLHSAVNFAYHQTKIIQKDADGSDLLFYRSNRFSVFTSVPSGSGGGDPLTIYDAADETFGSLYGLETERITGSGEIIYADQNGDGIAEGAPDILLQGTGLPDFTLGWSNKLSLETGWQFGLGLRGVYGHSLFNNARRTLETTANIGSDTNILQTEFFGDGISSFQQPDDRLIEKAGFTAIDFISIGKEIDVRNNFMRMLTLKITLQNPLWFTGYTGNDPTPRYGDTGIFQGSGLPAQRSFLPLSPGLDRLNYYPRTRSFVFSVEAAF